MGPSKCAERAMGQGGLMLARCLTVESVCRSEVALWLSCTATVRSVKVLAVWGQRG